MNEPNLETTEAPLWELLPEGAPGRDLLETKGYKGLGDLAKAYQNLNSEFQKGVRAPGEGASGEEWTAFYRRMGAPEGADGYEIPKTDDFTGKVLGELREVAFSEGLTKKQFESLAAKAAEIQGERDKEFREKLSGGMSKWEEAAKEKYGEALDSVKARAARAYNTLVKDNPDLDALLVETKLKDHPAVLDLMVKVSERMVDEQTPSSSGGAGPGGKTALQEGIEIKEEISKLYLGEEMNKPRHPGRARALERAMELQNRLMELGFEGATDPRLRSRFDVF